MRSPAPSAAARTVGAGPGSRGKSVVGPASSLMRPAVRRYHGGAEDGGHRTPVPACCHRPSAPRKAPIMPPADPESFVGTDRVLVRRRLGAGTFGVVYGCLER